MAPAGICSLAAARPSQTCGNIYGNSSKGSSKPSPRC